MKHIRILFIITMVALLLAACQPYPTRLKRRRPREAATNGTQRRETVTLKIAVLPIIDALPMYVAQQEGLFAQHGVNIELVSRGICPGAGPVGGSPTSRRHDQRNHFGHALQQRNHPGTGCTLCAAPKRRIWTLLHPGLGPERHHYTRGLKDVEIGVSQGTVIEYVTERLLQAEGLSANEILTLPVPKIPDRMALLASGELKAGTLPDPLGALAVQSGAVIVMDDSAHPEYGFSIYSFRKDVIDAQPEAIKGFLAAIEEAIALINADPTRFTDILSEAKIVPAPLLEAYKVPPFPAAGVPTEAEWNDALRIGPKKRDAKCGCLVCGLGQPFASALVQHLLPL